MSEIKRVFTLYRVSTPGQVDNGDIPMQKEYCRDFIAGHPDWVLVNEVFEKGVSGFKKSALERDAILALQRAALRKEMDVLLVYMFDRLGRRDNETPQIVEWFVQNGVEVWSATEGRRRLETHTDILLNYITFWQASCESVKTSIRVRTRMEQLTAKGVYTGGTVPYGYRLVHNGGVESDVIPELQIIDRRTYDEAQRLMSARTTKHSDTPLNMSGQSLLIGSLFCGCCRNRLTLSTSGHKHTRKDGTVIRKTRLLYQCHYGVRHPGECKGQTVYSAERLDAIVEEIILYQFSKVRMSGGVQPASEAHGHQSAEENDGQGAAGKDLRENNELRTWADLYKACAFDAKKLIVSRFIRSIHVHRGYNLEIEFNVPYEEFRRLTDRWKRCLPLPPSLRRSPPAPTVAAPSAPGAAPGYRQAAARRDGRL